MLREKQWKKGKEKKKTKISTLLAYIYLPKTSFFLPFFYESFPNQVVCSLVHLPHSAGLPLNSMFIC